MNSAETGEPLVDEVRLAVTSMNTALRVGWSISCVERLIPVWMDLVGGPGIPPLALETVVESAWASVIPSKFVDARAAAESLYSDTQAIESHEETLEARAIRRAEWLALALVSLEDSMVRDDLDAAFWLSDLSVEILASSLLYKDSGDRRFAIIEEANVASLVRMFRQVNLHSAVEVAEWRLLLRADGGSLLHKIRLADLIRSRRV